MRFILILSPDLLLFIDLLQTRVQTVQPTHYGRRFLFSICVSISIAIVHHRSARTVPDLTAIWNLDLLLSDSALIWDDYHTGGTLGVPIARS